MRSAACERALDTGSDARRSSCDASLRTDRRPARKNIIYRNLKALTSAVFAASARNFCGALKLFVLVTFTAAVTASSSEQNDDNGEKARKYRTNVILLLASGDRVDERALATAHRAVHVLQRQRSRGDPAQSYRIEAAGGTECDLLRRLILVVATDVIGVSRTLAIQLGGIRRSVCKNR